MRNIVLYLKDIHAAILAIESFVENQDFNGFKEDDKTNSAVIRKFEIIGEAAKNVPDEIQKRYPDIPWREMARMRDKLIHFYFGVQHELVWDTIKGSLPPLKPALEKAIAELEQPKKEQ